MKNTKEFMEPLCENKLISESEVRTIFSNIGTIKALNSTLYADLSARILNWSINQKFADIFLEFVLSSPLLFPSPSPSPSHFLFILPLTYLNSILIIIIIIFIIIIIIIIIIISIIIIIISIIIIIIIIIIIYCTGSAHFY